jgi:hypothetical protein
MKTPLSISGNPFRLAVFLVLAITGPTLRAGETNVNPTGTWKWVEPTNSDGRIPDITFVLKLEGDALTGTRITSTGTTTQRLFKTTILTNGVVKGDEVSFQTPRHETSFPKGRISFTTFSGKLSGDRIKGTVAIYVDDKIFGSQNWEVARVKQ